jgi:protein-L-isoaspartate(D-aspartate) O-methyltransferase
MIPDWEAERHRMVETQLRAHGIRDPRVLAAMLEIPREDFVPFEMRVLAYRDDPVPIGYGQTISQPYMTAIMAEVLELTGAESVLEVGAGCGYAAAVLGALAARVMAVEIVAPLVKMARANLGRSGRSGNVSVVDGDGSMGLLSGAPYDAISVAAGAPDVPQTLIDQLSDGGRLVIPVGDRLDQQLRLITKRGTRVESRVVTQCRFVPLRGDQGWQRGH